MGFEGRSGWQVYDRSGRRKYLNREERRRWRLCADAAPLPVRCLCYFLLYSGCRISEALSVRRDHVSKDEGGVWVRTLKRRKLVYRRVPLPPSLIGMLDSLPSGDDDRLWTVHRVTAWRWIRSIAELAEIDGPMACCRGLRHSFAMHAASSQVPPYALRQFLGHSSISTTMIYVDAVGAEEQEFAARMWGELG